MDGFAYRNSSRTSAASAAFAGHTNWLSEICEAITFMRNMILFSIAALSVVASSWAASFNREYEILKERRELDVDEEHFVAASSALDDFKSGKAIVIDLRKDDSVIVLGALRTPITALATNRFLKGKSLVLLNDGYGLRHLISVRKKLIDKGFKSVKVLKGGIKNWISAGGQTIGKASSYHTLDFISSAGLFNDKDFKGVTVVEVPTENDEPGIPGAIRLPSGTSVSQLSVILKDLSRRPGTLYVALSCSERSARLLRPLVKKAKNPVFFISGGTRSYDKWLHKQAALWRGRNSVRVRQKCPSCQ